uniref:Uncharacterized protein n=1 Tax=Arundo donax TaxID=35708 RepID=A0A0A9H933_ARUDO
MEPQAATVSVIR